MNQWEYIEICTFDAMKKAGKKTNHIVDLLPWPLILTMVQTGTQDGYHSIFSVSFLWGLNPLKKETVFLN